MSGLLDDSVDFGDAAEIDDKPNNHLGFCDGTNESNCIRYFNQEIDILGLNKIDLDVTTQHGIASLINSWHELLCLHHRELQIRADSDDNYHRLKSDYTSMQILNTRLTKDIDQRKHNYAVLKDKLQQCEHKNKSLSLKLKASKEEIKRLQSVMLSRDNLQKHVLKKREMEAIKLKERLNRILSDKPQMPLIEISKVVKKNDGKRATWRVGSSQPEEEWRRFVISTYEDQQHALILENRSMRDMLERMHEGLDGLTNNNHLAHDQNSDSESDRESVTETIAGHFQMPFELVKKDLDRKFMRTCKSLQALVNVKSQPGSRPVTSPSSPSLSPSSPPHLNNDTRDIQEMNRRLKIIKQLVKEQEQVIVKKQKTLERCELCPVQPHRVHRQPVAYTQNEDGLKVVHTTPTFSPNPKASISTPSTEELYRWMGLATLRKHQRESSSTPHSASPTHSSTPSANNSLNTNHNSLPYRQPPPLYLPSPEHSSTPSANSSFNSNQVPPHHPLLTPPNLSIPSEAFGYRQLVGDDFECSRRAKCYSDDCVRQTKRTNLIKSFSSELLTSAGSSMQAIAEDMDSIRQSLSQRILLAEDIK